MMRNILVGDTEVIKDAIVKYGLVPVVYVVFI